MSICFNSQSTICTFIMQLALGFCHLDIPQPTFKFHKGQICVLYSLYSPKVICLVSSSFAVGQWVFCFVKKMQTINSSLFLLVYVFNLQSFNLECFSFFRLHLEDISSYTILSLRPADLINLEVRKTLQCYNPFAF